MYARRCRARQVRKYSRIGVEAEIQCGWSAGSSYSSARIEPAIVAQGVLMKTWHYVVRSQPNVGGYFPAAPLDLVSLAPRWQYRPGSGTDNQFYKVHRALFSFYSVWLAQSICCPLAGLA
jgi:hypothetical protein